jgi:hypothetical protein
MRARRKNVGQSLLDISEELVAFRQLLEESADEDDGEISPAAAEALEAWFAELETNRDAKVDAYCHLVREWNLQAACRRAEAEQIQAEANRLKAVAAARENRVKRLKERLKQFMEFNGLKKIETASSKAAVCGNGGNQSVQVNCLPEQLPPAFQKVVVSPATDELRKALLAGQRVEGVELLPRGTHLRIS